MAPNSRIAKGFPGSVGTAVSRSKNAISLLPSLPPPSVEAIAERVLRRLRKSRDNNI